MSTRPGGAATSASSSSEPAHSHGDAAGAIRVSVVVPTYRRPALIVRCLEALVAQSLGAEAFEIVVVDDGRTDETREAVQAFARRYPGHAIRYLRPASGRGPAVARNCGWRAARAPAIAFTDDDTVADVDWLKHGVRALADDVAAVAGRVRVPLRTGALGGGRVRVTDHQLMTLGLEHAEFVTANAFVRRRALEEVGGFDERFARAWREDSDLQFMLLEQQARVVRCMDAVVLHPVRPEAWGVSLRQQKNVFYDALLYRKHPRLYRERVLPAPPWNYYATVVLTIAALVFWALGNVGSAAVSAVVALVLVVAFALRRLRTTSLAPAHVLEMFVTSAAIPFLSVYWRLRGALHFRVGYW